MKWKSPKTQGIVAMNVFLGVFAKPVSFEVLLEIALLQPPVPNGNKVGNKFFCEKVHGLKT